MTPPASESGAAGTVRRAAAAKLNLYLHVVGRRADGYHVLDSLVAFASVHDTITASPADELTLAADGPFAGTLEAQTDNLVLQAARRLAEAAGLKAGARIRLMKRLPVASGLGGGSADAAATLEALTRLWGLEVPRDRLVELALEIGADVPVCLLGRAAFIGGIGDEIEPAPALPDAWVVLANPGRPLSTPQVFAARSGPFNAPARFRERARDAAELAALLLERHNDLTSAAVTLCPEVGAAIGALTRAPGCRLARMSGSGATCFGLFEDEGAARRAAADLEAAEPGWWVAPARLVDDTNALEPAP
ncbi:MAG: 4-(cytidine 5'-diphospho)-2-C-methyl-D-erythritol kinase [Alphaproteobacteria bacterium]